MISVRRFMVSILFTLLVGNGEHTSLKSELDIPSMKPKLSEISTHASSWADTPLVRMLPRIFNPYESADAFIPGAKLIRSELVSSRIFDVETLLFENPYT